MNEKVVIFYGSITFADKTATVGRLDGVIRCDKTEAVDIAESMLDCKQNACGDLVDSYVIAGLYDGEIIFNNETFIG